MLNIVLVQPEIPPNTGNIARLTAALNVKLHLIEPFPFELSDKQVRRAGLDYWQYADVSVHKDWDGFTATSGCSLDSIWYFSTHAKRSHFEANYSNEQFLVFGSETKGLPKEIVESYPERGLRIPMENNNVRSLNLSNAVAIALYEAKRQLGMG